MGKARTGGKEKPEQMGACWEEKPCERCVGKEGVGSIGERGEGGQNRERERER